MVAVPRRAVSRRPDRKSLEFSSAISEFEALRGGHFAYALDEAITSRNGVSQADAIEVERAIVVEADCQLTVRNVRLLRGLEVDEFVGVKGGERVTGIR